MTNLSIDLRGLASGRSKDVNQARKQLSIYFNGNLEAMRRYYQWKPNAPVLAIIRG